MANESILKFGSAKTLVSSGASVASGAISGASASPYTLSSDAANYPHARFVLGVTFSGAPAANSAVILVARPKNVDGANNSPAPTATYAQRYIGSFITSADTTQYLTLMVEDVKLPWDADYYVINQVASVSMNSTWTLKATPYTYGPAA